MADIDLGTVPRKPAFISTSQATAAAGPSPSNLSLALFRYALSRTPTPARFAKRRRRQLETVFKLNQVGEGNTGAAINRPLGNAPTSEDISNGLGTPSKGMENLSSDIRNLYQGSDSINQSKGLFVSDKEEILEEASRLNEIDKKSLKFGQNDRRTVYTAPQIGQARSLKRTQTQAEIGDPGTKDVYKQPGGEPIESLPKKVKRAAKKLIRNPSRSTALRLSKKRKRQETQEKKKKTPRRLAVGELALVMDKIFVEEESFQSEHGGLVDDSIVGYDSPVHTNTFHNRLKSKSRPISNNSKSKPRKALGQLQGNISLKKKKVHSDLCEFKVIERSKLSTKALQRVGFGVPCSDGFEGFEALPTGKIAPRKQRPCRQRRVTKRHAVRMGELTLIQSRTLSEDVPDICSGHDPTESVHVDRRTPIIDLDTKVPSPASIKEESKKGDNSRIEKLSGSALPLCTGQKSQSVGSLRNVKQTQTPPLPLKGKSTLKRGVDWNPEVRAWTQLMTVRAPILLTSSKSDDSDMENASVLVYSDDEREIEDGESPRIGTEEEDDHYSESENSSKSSEEDPESSEGESEGESEEDRSDGEDSVEDYDVVEGDVEEDTKHAKKENAEECGQNQGSDTESFVKLTACQRTPSTRRSTSILPWQKPVIPATKFRSLELGEECYEILAIENELTIQQLAEPGDILLHDDASIEGKEYHSLGLSISFREPVPSTEIGEDENENTEPIWRPRIPIPRGLMNEEEENDDIVDSPIPLRRTFSIDDEGVRMATRALAALPALERPQDSKGKGRLPKYARLEPSTQNTSRPTKLPQTSRDKSVELGDPNYRPRNRRRSSAVIPETQDSGKQAKSQEKRVLAYAIPSYFMRASSQLQQPFTGLRRPSAPEISCAQTEGANVKEEKEEQDLEADCQKVGKFEDTGGITMSEMFRHTLSSTRSSLPYVPNRTNSNSHANLKTLARRTSIQAGTTPTHGRVRALSFNPPFKRVRGRSVGLSRG